MMAAAVVARLPKPMTTVSCMAPVLPNQGVERLVDGEMNPACAFQWQDRPIELTVDFGEEREVGGVRIMAGRSYTNRGVQKASFYADGKPLAEHVAFRPAHTFKENYATWKPVRCRRVKMVIEGTYDQAAHYYCGSPWVVQQFIQQIFESPAYKVKADSPCTVQIAELGFFGSELPDDLPLPNPPAQLDANFRGDGFGFTKDVQPILDRKCISCHGEGHRLDLRAVPGKIPPSDDQSHRAYTASYLALSEKGKCTENVNFAHGLGFAPFKPPYSFGALRSRWYAMLKNGHPAQDGAKRVALTDAELRTFALWIDLAVPFCSSYVEANTWCAWHAQRFVYTNNKRSAFHWLELNDVRCELGLAPVPLTGFEPGVKEPRKQNHWAE